MKRERIVLRVDGEPYTAQEVIAAAVIAGRADELLRRLEDGMASAALAEELDEEVEHEDLQEALDSWRLARDLVAADELQAWLEEEGLDLDDVVEHLEREIFRDRLAHGLLSRPGHRRPGPADVLAALPTAVAVEGLLPEYAEVAAYRAVARVPEAEAAAEPEAGAPHTEAGAAEPGAPAREAPEGAPAETPARPEESWAGLDDEPGDEEMGWLAEWLAPLGLPSERLRVLVEREETFSLVRRTLGGPESIAQALRDEGGQLVSYDIADASFRTADVAREVICCVREDRESLLHAAGRAGEGSRREVLPAEALGDRPYRHRLPSACPRDVFGPYPDDGRQLVVQLLRRLDPDPDSDETRDLLVERIVRRTLGREVLDRARIGGAGPS